MSAPSTSQASLLAGDMYKPLTYRQTGTATVPPAKVTAS